MDFPRRWFLRFGGGSLATSFAFNSAKGQTYPTRPVRLIAATSPGSAPDVIARIISQILSERLRQPFIIENRAGGGGNIGTEAAVRAAGDGYTLLLVSIAHATNASLYDKLSFNFLRDIAPVAGVIRIPNLLVVHPSLPVKSFPELIAYAKQNPGKINVASAGTGSAPHLAYELLAQYDGPRSHSCALSRSRTRVDRPACGARTDDVSHYRFIYRARRGRKAASRRGDEPDEVGGLTKYSSSERFPSAL